MPYSVPAFITDMPPRMASSAFSRSAGVHEVCALLNGADSLMPSFLAILYSVELGMPYSLEALLAEMRTSPGVREGTQCQM